MRVLITGALGQLGRALTDTAPGGAEVTAVDMADFDLCDEHAVSRHVADLAPALIINTAAYTAVDKAEAEPEAAFRSNRDAVRNLARAAAKAGAKLVHVSTDFVFDGAGSRPIMPDAPTVPLGVYGASKLAGETEAMTAPDALVVRTAWLYSAVGQNFVRTMLRLMNERPSLNVVSDQISTPTSAASLAAALWALAERSATGMHHYTDAGVASWYDFAQAISEEGALRGLCPTGIGVVPIRTEDYPTPARRPAYSVLDKTATWAAIGWRPMHWREELRATLDRISTDG